MFDSHRLKYVANLTYSSKLWKTRLQLTCKEKRRVLAWYEKVGKRQGKGRKYERQNVEASKRLDPAPPMM